MAGSVGTSIARVVDLLTEELIVAIKWLEESQLIWNSATC